MKMKSSRAEPDAGKSLVRMSCIAVFLLLSSIFNLACGANQNILRSGKETPNQTRSEYDKPTAATEVEAMQTAGFAFIYVLRRKDGAALVAEDRSLIKQKRLIQTGVLQLTKVGR